MRTSIKCVVLTLNILSTLLLRRPFGSVLHDIAVKYEGVLSVADLRRLEKLKLKFKKAELDVTFLVNCQNLNL